jgi:hypothetical protein
MNVIMKPAIVLGLAGALALGTMTSSEARNRAWIGAGAGFVAGAIVGGAVANANRGYYYSDPAYAYEPYYAPAPVYAAPVYADPVYSDPGYAYAPGPVYVGPRYYNNNNWRERQMRGQD